MKVIQVSLDILVPDNDMSDYESIIKNKIESDSVEVVGSNQVDISEFYSEDGGFINGKSE